MSISIRERLSETFVGHAGRPGQRGGSSPRSGGGGKRASGGGKAEVKSNRLRLRGANLGHPYMTAYTRNKGANLTDRQIRTGAVKLAVRLASKRPSKSSTGSYLKKITDLRNKAYHSQSDSTRAIHRNDLIVRTLSPVIAKYSAKGWRRKTSGGIHGGERFTSKWIPPGKK